MDKIDISFSSEDSPASIDGVATSTKVKINNIDMRDFLDIHEFFNSLTNTGFIPLFTCGCGDFGCGGYYTKVTHDQDSWTIQNSYQPHGNCDETALIDKFKYSIPWDSIIELASKILNEIKKIHEQHPNSEIFSGVCGIDISKKINEYEKIIQSTSKNGNIA